MDPYLSKLNMTRDDANEVSPRLSQSFMLEDIDLGADFMAIPSCIFASLPLIREDPSRLKFYDGHPSTDDTIHKMCLLANYLPDARITFKDPIGDIEEHIFPAGTSTYNVLCRLLPELSSVFSILVFVRTQKKDGTRLLLRPSSVPIGLYDMPNCIWTVELLYVPNYLKYNDNYIRLLNQWFVARKAAYAGRKPANENILENFANEVLEVQNQDELNAFLDKIGPNESCARVRKYVTSELVITLDWVDDGKEVTVKKGSKKYRGLNLHRARINKNQDGAYVFSMKGMDDIEMNVKDANSLLEFFNLAVLEKKAEEHPECALSFLFPDPDEVQNNVPQITSQSKINRLRLDMAKQIIVQMHNEIKEHKQYGWTEPEIKE